MENTQRTIEQAREFMTDQCDDYGGIEEVREMDTETLLREYRRTVIEDLTEMPDSSYAKHLAALDYAIETL